MVQILENARFAFKQLDRLQVIDPFPGEFFDNTLLQGMNIFCKIGYSKTAFTDFV